MYIVLVFIAVVIILRLLNRLSYIYLKNKIIKSQKWDLNICSGKTDGGGINADVVRFGNVHNFELISDIYHLPFSDNQFKSVLCSHTMEHVEDPDAFFRELKRVGEVVVILTPPLWDIGAVINIFEHKWIFLSFKTKHVSLPRKVRLPGANRIHKLIGQVFHA